MTTKPVRATVKVRTPQEFERWRRLAEETRRKTGNITPPTEANK